MAEPLDFQKNSLLERRCNKSVGFYALLGLLGGFAEWKKGPFWACRRGCGAEKGHAFWSKSVDFYALFGLLGGDRGVEKGQAV